MEALVICLNIVEFLGPSDETFPITVTVDTIEFIGLIFYHFHISW